MGGAAARARLVAVIEPALTRAGFDLEDVSVQRAGARSLLRVVVDRDGGVDLDSVAEASRVVGEALDAGDDALGDALPGPYVLEVTSPGVDRPLTAPRHWRRALGRVVRVVTDQGTVLTGRLVAADEQCVELAPDDRADPGADHRSVVRVRYPDVRRAVVQVEFTGAAGGGHAERGADDGDGP